MFWPRGAKKPPHKIELNSAEQSVNADEMTDQISMDEVQTSPVLREAQLNAASTSSAIEHSTLESMEPSAWHAIDRTPDGPGTLFSQDVECAGFQGEDKEEVQTSPASREVQMNPASTTSGTEVSTVESTEPSAWHDATDRTSGEPGACLSQDVECAGFEGEDNEGDDEREGELSLVI
jgi:hypothetical protein